MLREIHPSIFRRGNIVEVEGTVSAFIIRGKNVKVVFHLNAIIMENSKYSDVSGSTSSYENLIISNRKSY